MENHEKIRDLIGNNKIIDALHLINSLFGSDNKDLSNQAIILKQQFIDWTNQYLEGRKPPLKEKNRIILAILNIADELELKGDIKRTKITFKPINLPFSKTIQFLIGNILSLLIILLLCSIIYQNYLNTSYRKKEYALHLGEYWDTNLSYEVRDTYYAYSKWYDSYGTNDNIERNAWLSAFTWGRKIEESEIKNTIDLKNAPNSVKELIKSLYQKNKEDGTSVIQPRDLEQIRVRLVVLLNVMEQVAIAYKYDSANKEMLEELFKGALLNYYKKMKPFIDKYRDVHNHSAWVVYEELAEGEWAN